METMHFTELKEFAVKDKVERGRVYIYCFPQIGEHKKDWYPEDEWDEEAGWSPPQAQSNLLLTASHLVEVKRRSVLGLSCEELAPLEGDPYWDRLDLGFWEYIPSRRSSRLQWHYAIDSGVVGGYRNYMLDRLALLREGIIVDMSTITLLEPSTDELTTTV